MSSISICLFSLACMAGGVLIGAIIRHRLPEHHIRDDSKDVVKTVTGMMATLIALVIGLLVSAAKETFDTTSAGITAGGAKIIVVDRILSRFGPDAKPARDQLRLATATGIERIWTTGHKKDVGLNATQAATGMEDFYDIIRGLSPKDDSQRYLQAQAQQLAFDLMQSRWMLIEQSQNHLPTMLLVVLISWLTILFISFSLLAPQNMTAITALLVCGISISISIFLILELNRPLEGTIKVSNAPLQKALDIISK